MSSEVKSYSHRHRAQLEATLQTLKPGDFIMTASGTGVNAAARNAGHSDYGHAMLYAGCLRHGHVFPDGFRFSGRTRAHAFFELPANYGAVPEAFVIDQTFRCLLVRVKGLHDRLRQMIVRNAAAHYRRHAGSLTNGYSHLSIATGGVRDVMGGAAAHAIADHRGKSDPVMYGALPAGRAAKTFPRHVCSGFVAWCHAAAGAPLRGGWTEDTNVTPGELHQAVRRQPHRFQAVALNFERAS